MLIAPLSPEISPFNYQPPALLIFISEPEQQTEAVEERLQQLYKLTPAETKVAVILIRGNNIVAAAVELLISPPAPTSNVSFRKPELTGRRTGQPAAQKPGDVEIMPARKFFAGITQMGDDKIAVSFYPARAESNRLVAPSQARRSRHLASVSNNSSTGMGRAPAWAELYPFIRKET
ncbi:MAG TPA: hypothetical protein PLD20_04335 [Blastocatellia bacterium]|nr:hypothetical protein [Blastocatellia bacterium]HMX28039.1 hypothetical protein [Blastocatellia bacterium]HMZ17134.1 hypothetical protein [Blastocatellia bacterium]HNG32616.1 hypothetical protein [Blastocatellia bacterium]